MDQKDLSELTDQELLTEAKKMKSSFITNAFFIGFLIGIVVFSIVKNSWGFFTLLPLYFAYRLIKNSKKDKDLKKELAARNLS
jgi:hypothetical protein